MESADRKPVVNQLSPRLHIMISGTMSAGKSSFINALLGTEILHSANEAKTACITGILCESHNDQQFDGICYSHDGHRLAQCTSISAKTIQKWNANPAVWCIFLNGSSRPIFGNTYSVMLYDTPGPNNSQNNNHARSMLEAIRTIEFKSMFYILNVTQIGVTDDRTLLERLYREIRHKPDVSIYFILNKVDVLDPDIGESIEKYVQNVQHYLEEIGFKQPIIIPMMAHVALCARKALDHIPLTRRERLELRRVMEKPDAEKRAFVQATRVSEPIKERVMSMFDGLACLRLKKRHEAISPQVYELQELVVASGLCTAEFLIRDQQQR